MRLIGLAVVLAVALGLAPSVGEAQPGARVPRIGTLGSGSVPNEPFRQGLRDLGYIEGQNIVVERPARGSEVRYGDLPRIAAELVRLKVDVIVALSSETSRVARDTITTVPVVFVTFADPVRAGLVGSLARPGRNMTGITMIAGELIGKRLELLRQILPNARRVAVLWNPENRDVADQLDETRTVARSLGIESDAHGARTSREIDQAFAAMAKAHVDALFVLPDGLFARERQRIARLAQQRRLPGIYHWRTYVDAGGLMSYGPNLDELQRRAAVYVDKILKGAKPADLPVEQPTKFELVINLKTAKALGLTIPQSLLVRADQIIQ